MKKANIAQTSAAKTKNESTRRSKMRAYESALRDGERAQREIASLRKKMAAKQSEVQLLDNRIAREEKREAQKVSQEYKRSAKKVDMELNALSSTVRGHETRIEQLEFGPGPITVLYLGTSPIDEDRLRVDAEARSIYEAIRKSDNPQRVRLCSRWAVRQDDLLQVLNETDRISFISAGTVRRMGASFSKTNSGVRSGLIRSALRWSWAPLRKECALLFLTHAIPMPGQRRCLTVWMLLLE